jgi:threonyl-tRNA synthetase
MSEIKVLMPDKSEQVYPRGITGYEIAKSISESLAKKSLAAQVNGQIIELNRPIEENIQEFKLLTWEDQEGKSTFWHSSAHILAEAILYYYPNAKLGFGPPIEEGFYYDVDFGDETFTQEDFEKIEKKFLELASSGETFVRKNVSKQEAIQYYTENYNPYKLELISELEDGNITFYESGNFVDLCKGPHIYNSKVIKAVKILNLAGAYWRGKSENKQLTRIYAISFPSQKELQEYLHYLEEAAKRDHRKLGKELNMFSFHEEGPGFPFWHNNGMIVLNELQNFLRKKLYRLGYEEIKTPLILNDELWRKSGHYDNYKENMYFTEIDEKQYAVKPMNCPGCTIIYRTELHSYRDLPRRYFEFGHVHRHEMSGALAGLFRVRSFTQDDAHIFCTPEQVESEILNLIRLIFEVYSTFGFEDVSVGLSTRPEKYIGDLGIWNKAEEALKKALETAGVSYHINEGDGAFYGPKIDFTVRDSLKRKWQLGTIQLDFSMPYRFGLEYVGSEGTNHQPVMIHRAILGSFERFVGVLLEHTAGELPLWLCPTQVIILPISDKFQDYTEKIRHKLEEMEIRVSVDYRSEKIQRKIRDAEVQKIPFMLIIGEQEQNLEQVSLREHKKGDKGKMSFMEFISYFNDELKKSYQYQLH